MTDVGQPKIMAAGAVAAFTVDLLIYPLDTIKTRYQNENSSGLRDHLSLPRRQTVRGLYQGLGSVVLATLPAAAIFFASYESAKSLLKYALPVATPGPAIHALAAAGAEMASCVVLTPAEVVKQNAQVIQRPGSSQSGRFSSLQAFRMLRGSGRGMARTFWSGYTAMVTRNLPFTAIQFPMFEFLRGRLQDEARKRRCGAPTLSTEQLPDGDPSYGSGRANFDPAIVETGLTNGAAAALSGSIAATVTTPADVVKTRVMLGARRLPGTTGAQEIRPAEPANSSGLGVVKAVIRESGLRGLFRGATLRAAWTALGSGLYLGSYEVTKFWLGHRSP